MNKQHERACCYWLETRPPEEYAIRRVLAGKGASCDRLARPVVVTVFGGHYEEPAGYIIALNGSPVKAVILRLAQGGAMIWRGYSPARLGDENTRAVYAYLESLHMPKHATDTPYPFVMYIDGERVEGAAFHVKPWFFRNPELYQQLREETPDT